jgi:major vault protein
VFKVKVLCVDSAVNVKMNQALKLRAKVSFFDKRVGVHRETGDRWIHALLGPVILYAQEEIIETLEAIVLDEKTCVHLKATSTFVDRFGKQRKVHKHCFCWFDICQTGDQWILTRQDVALFLPSIHEEIVAKESIKTLSKRQFCIIKDPYNVETETYQVLVFLCVFVN